MAASGFRSLSEENIAQLFNDKDSENTKESTKQHRLIFESEPHDQGEKHQKSYNCSGVSGSFTKVLRRGEKKGWTDVLKKTRFVPSGFLCLTV